MQRGRTRQRVEVVPAFERGDDAPVGETAGGVDDQGRDPPIVVVLEGEPREGVCPVGIEAGGNQYQFGSVLFEGRQPVRAPPPCGNERLSVPATRGVLTILGRFTVCRMPG